MPEPLIRANCKLGWRGCLSLFICSPTTNDILPPVSRGGAPPYILGHFGRSVSRPQSMDLSLPITTDDSKSVWHSLMNSPKHSSKQDKPEREVIAFSTGFEMLQEPTRTAEMGTASQWILKLLLPIMLAIFIIANVIIIRVMHNISQWKFPPCLYVMILAVIDLAVNTVRLLDYWCQVAFSVRFLNALSLTSDAVCSTMTISIYFLFHLSSMIRSAFCIDLYYSYKCPLDNSKKVILCRIEHLILLFISVLLIFNSHFLWTYSLLHMNHKQTLVPPGNYCTYLVKWVSPTFRDVLWPMVDILIGEICPIMSVIFSTALITTTIRSGSCCSSFSSSFTSSRTGGPLSRFMIDVSAFIEMRRFLLIYNLISFVMILIPSLVVIIYKGLTYQRNHAMKIVTAFSTTRSSSRSYMSPWDIVILDTVHQLTVLVYPVVVVLSGRLFSGPCFKGEMSSICTLVAPRSHRKINFLI